MTINLRIKRVYLNEIISGQKKTEYRRICKYYIARLSPGPSFDVREDIDSVRFYVSKNEFAIVELKRIDVDQNENVFLLRLGKIQSASKFGQH